MHENGRWRIGSVYLPLGAFREAVTIFNWKMLVSIAPGIATFVLPSLALVRGHDLAWLCWFRLVV